MSWKLSTPSDWFCSKKRQIWSYYSYRKIWGCILRTIVKIEISWLYAVLAFFQLVEFLFKFFLNISICGCFGFNCVQTYLILASNYLHHMNSYPASLSSSKGQSKQSFRVLTNHPAGVKMYKNRWNNSKTGAATSMYTQWAKKWTSGCNEYIPQKLKSTLLEIYYSWFW